VCNLTDLWLVSATMAKNVETAIDKELRDLVSTLRDHRLRHHEPCMAGTRPGILQEFDRSLIIDIRVPVFVPDPFFYFILFLKNWQDQSIISLVAIAFLPRTTIRNSSACRRICEYTNLPPPPPPPNPSPPDTQKPQKKHPPPPQLLL